MTGSGLLGEAKIDGDQGGAAPAAPDCMPRPRRVTPGRHLKVINRSDRSTGGIMKSDSDIKKDVEDEIRWDPDIDATDIAITVKKGIVTLTGFVRNYVHKYEAERAVKRVAGVVGLANDIEGRFPG